MKRIVYPILLLIVILGIRHDLTGGTLIEDDVPPPSSLQPDLVTDTSAVDEPHQEVIIEPGQTVLSIVERLHSGQVNVSIDQILMDFKRLNNDVNPNALQIGKSYLFPLYQ
ncbi:hypothetical protein JOC54_001360 [Alkalihalobacillus xiaoxiensis]|uniref:LysM domain-containing protein n=1 Tax=Shouchella xiaoxiensis TaxID=766895 RepID=A0ABS2SRI4_9BACI|nr:hypothetical protein [Shouchella xiaoxiensis]MBM7838129.1 hypothetical protein [Shouchella xiaoxiensis]